MKYLTLSRATVHMFGFGPYRGSEKYEEIKDDLEPEEHFVDFPLPQRLHDENLRMMANSPSVFSRYTRFRKYDGIEHNTIRAAEEFLPLLNSARTMVSHLVSLSIAPLAVLEKWADWIRAEEVACLRGEDRKETCREDSTRRSSASRW